MFYRIFVSTLFIRFVCAATYRYSVLLWSMARQFDRMKHTGIKFHERVPDVSHLQKWFTAKGGILVLDDLMAEDGNEKEVMDLFTKHSHHQNITFLYLCQDMFPPGKYAKTITRNSHYIVAFKNPRDQLSMRNILLQAYLQT